jgi:thiol:disulfide interchange protein DsbD
MSIHPAVLGYGNVTGAARGGMSECHLAISRPADRRITSRQRFCLEVSMRPMIAIALLALLSAIPVGAQDDAARAVQWSWRLEPRDARPGSDAELVLEASIAPDWVVYSSDFEAELGPRPTRLRKQPQSSLELTGPLRSVGALHRRDADLGLEYGYFAGRAELRQRLRLPADGSPVEVTLRGQACHEANGTCHLIRQDVRITGQVASAAPR